MTSTTLDLDHLPERPRGADTWYQVLDVDRDVDVTGLLLAYERAVALIEGRHLGGYFLLDPAAIAVARLDIEAALAILGDVERRQAYDRSLDGDDADGPTVPPTTTPTAPMVTLTPRTLTPSLRFLAPVEGSDNRSATVPPATVPPATVPPAPVSSPARAGAAATLLPQPAMLGSTVPPTPSRTSWSPLPPAAPRPTSFVSSGTPRPTEVPNTSTPTPLPGIFSLDGEVNGQTLRRLREARSLTIDELAEATKIRRPYLAAIEEQDLDALPSRVYLRGFLTQIARVLRVDKQKLADGYLAFIARFGR
jgi:hypothetical protein